VPLGVAGTFRLCSLAHLDAAADQHGSLKFLALCSPILEYIPQDWAAAATVVSAKRLRVRNNLAITPKDSTSTNRRYDWSKSEIEQTATLRGGKVLNGSDSSFVCTEHQNPAFVPSTRTPPVRRTPGRVLLWAPGTNGRVAGWGSAADLHSPLPVLGRLSTLKSPGAPRGSSFGVGSLIQPNVEGQLQNISNFNSLSLRVSGCVAILQQQKLRYFNGLAF
jgi:hypothetical protein